ncbi:MAG: hypothetical protein Q9225_002367 [Loekoesia sp. 1 TL-2023]
MRDHWRDEGHRREDSVYRGRQRERSSDRRKPPAALKKRERSIDVEVKIKGHIKTGSLLHTRSSDQVVHLTAGSIERGHTSNTREQSRTDTPTTVIIEEAIGSTLTTGKGPEADLHIEQPLLAPETGKEAHTLIIHVVLIIASKRELDIVSIDIPDHHLLEAPTITLIIGKATRL